MESFAAALSNANRVAMAAPSECYGVRWLAKEQAGRIRLVRRYESSNLRDDENKRNRNNFNLNASPKTHSRNIELEARITAKGHQHTLL